MNKLKKNYENLTEMIDEFSSQIQEHIKNEEMSDKLISLLQKPKKVEDINSIDDLFQSTADIIFAFEYMLFMMVYDSETSNSIGTSIVYEILNPGDIYTAADYAMYDIYEYVAHSDEEYKAKLLNLCKRIQVEHDLIDEVIPDSQKYFADINATMLMTNEEILTKDQLPKGAKIVEINIPNTIMRTFSIRPLVDKNFIYEKFGKIIPDCGLSEEVVKRFNYDNEYDTTDVKHKSTIPGDIYDINLYQYIGKLDGKKYYRKLEDFKENDVVRRYSKLGFNVFQTNFENKRLMLLKRVKKRVKKNIINKNVISNFKKNYNQGQSLGAAIFNELYNPSMEDETIIRLVSFSLEFNENGSAPQEDKYYFNKEGNFRKFNSI